MVQASEDRFIDRDCQTTVLEAVRSERHRPWLAAALLVFLAIKLVHGAIVLTPTFDEYKHALSGWAFLKTGICCAGQSDTAMVAVNGIPWLLMGAVPISAPRSGQTFDWGSAADRYPPVHWRNTLARIPNVLLALLLAWLVHREARAMAGETSGLLALALACACPNLTAHGMLVSTDAQGALGFLIGVLGFASWMRRGMGRDGFLLAAMAFALAQIAKYSSLLLVPGLALVALLCGGRSWRERLAAALKATAVFLLGFALVVLVYELPERLAPASDLARQIGDLRGPRGYLGGFALPWAMGHHGVPGYFLGEFGTTWRLFYLTAVLVKTPLSILLASALGIVALWRQRFSWRERLLWTVPATVAFVASSLSKVTFALRYVLQIYPFLMIVGGLSVRLVPSKWRTPAALALALAALVEGSLIHPNELAFFNVAAGGPRHGARYFLDSNIDWGQSLADLAAELKRRHIDHVWLAYHGSIMPEIYHIDATPLEPRRRVSGWVAISVTKLFGLYVPAIPDVDADAYAWLRDLEPQAVIGHTIYLYHVP
ncbi:MAG: glycosyltransferase family 39 protein [Planctomycetota bacterium]